VIPDEIISSPSPVEKRHDQRSTITTKVNASQIARPIIEQRTDERTIRTTPNSISSLPAVPIEIHHDQRTMISATTIPPRLPSSSSIENRFDERVTTPVTTNISPTRVQSTEIDIKQSPVVPVTSSNNVPPRPPPPSISNEVIYTEVIKNHERPLSFHHADLVKSSISPSRSFIIPKKSSNTSSKTPSYNFPRPSRTPATTNLSYQTNKPRPMQSMMTSDRISLYSQRSNKQSDVGVTIKNLSECIDRVGIVFDETNRPHDTQSAGLTTVDLIREQLTTASISKPTGSLLDKLHKSNSSTRLSSSSSRTSMTIATPRSKSQQAPRIHDEQQPSTSK